MKNMFSLLACTKSSLFAYLTCCEIFIFLMHKHLLTCKALKMSFADFANLRIQHLRAKRIHMFAQNTVHNALHTSPIDTFANIIIY